LMRKEYLICCAKDINDLLKNNNYYPYYTFCLIFFFINIILSHIPLMKFLAASWRGINWRIFYLIRIRVRATWLPSGK
jgi:hypothetical protein